MLQLKEQRPSTEPAMRQPKNLTQLQDLIESGEWPTGTRLAAERPLALQLGCSRSALRETLQRLRSRGFLQSKRGAGSVVTASSASPLLALLEQSPRSRQELVLVRSALDALAAEAAAELADDRELATIRRLHREYVAASARQDRAAMVHSDTALHLAIAAASHNKVLVEVVRSLRQALQACIRISADKLLDQQNFSQTVIEQHADIVTAIGRRDGQAARQAAERHTAEISTRLQALTP